MAATSTLKLVLDDKEYSASIRSAKQGMNDLQQSLQTAGKSFTEVDKHVVDYAKAIGNMSTVAKDSKGQLREMSQTLTDLTRVYRQLTDDEKSSDFGKALSSSIKTLTDRAGEVQDAMGDVQASIHNAASDTRLFDQMTQGAQVLTAGFQGLTGAGKMLGLNMDDNVEIIAKLQSAMAVMNSLTTIQNALQKQSALMMGLSAIKAKLLDGNLTAAAVAAKALSVAMKGLGIGLAIAAITTIIDKLGIFSSSSDKATDSTDRFNDALDRMDNKVKELQTGFQSLISYMQQIGSGSDALDDLRKQAADEEVALAVAEYKRLFNGGMGGVTGRFMTAFNQVAIPQSVQQQALDKITSARERQAEVYAEIANRQKAGDFFNSNWNTLNTEKEINAAIGYFRNLRSEMEKGSAEYAEMTRRIDALQAKITTGGRGGGGSRGNAASLVPQYSVAGLTEDLRYLQQEQAKATSTEEWKTYQDAIRSVNDEVKKLKGELSALGTDNTTGGISISRMLSENVAKRQEAFKTQKLDVKVPAEKEKGGSFLESSQNLISGLSSVSSGLQQMGVKIPDGVQKLMGGIQGLMSVIQGVQSIISIFNTTTATTQTITTNTNTAAMTALTSAVIANTAAVTTSTITPSFFAGGGVVHAASGYVGGSHFSGDLVPALLNSGELVLNQAQQGNIASQLMAASIINGGGVGGHDYVSGQNIFLGTNNYLKGSGQGQLVTTRMLRQYGLIN